MYRTVYCGPNGVLITEVLLYRTAYYGPNGVLITEVSLYRTAYYNPNGVLITEVSLYSLSMSVCVHTYVLSLPCLLYGNMVQNRLHGTVLC